MRDGRVGCAMTTGGRGAGLALALPGLVGILAAAVLQDRQADASAPLQASAAQLPLPPATKEMGFLLTHFLPAYRRDAAQCPDGYGRTLREAYLATQPEAERTRLNLRENQAELEERWKAYAMGPNGTNICTNVESFDRPANPLVGGRIARGMDLDGDASGAGGDDTCAHANFIGEDGAQGIDNQAFRALGCSAGAQVPPDESQGPSPMNEKLVNGEHTMVLLIRGVDSLVRDNDVEVIFASSGDMAVTDTRKKAITGASFTVTDNPRWRNVLKARIADGVLTTEPADLHTSQKWGHGGIRGQRAEYVFLKGRFRLAFQPDGSIAGMLGGYQPIGTLIQTPVLGGVGSAVIAGIDCAGIYSTLRKVADGIKDPKTGKCTAASSAMELKAVPAFVFDTPPRGGGRVAKR